MSRFRPMVSRRTPSASSFAEMFLAPGPQAIGQTGDNSYQTLFGRDWLLLWGRDDDLLRLYQEQGGAWVEVVDELPPVFGSPAPAGSRRWSVAFDQSARVIVAYEDSEGVVRVTRWDPSLNQYVQNVTFAGVDPCVVMDASWSYSVPGSDVLLFYLSPDRSRVLCRVQRDIYAIEHEIWDFGAPVILDRVIALPYRYQVLVSDSTGTPLSEVLLSGLYHVQAWTFAAASSLPPASGAYARVVLSFDMEVETVESVATGPASGSYDEPIIDVLLPTDELAASGVGPAAGAYSDPIIELTLKDEVSAGGEPPEGGEYKLVVVKVRPQPDEAAATSVGPAGGTYA